MSTDKSTVATWSVTYARPSVRILYANTYARYARFKLEGKFSCRTVLRNERRPSSTFSQVQDRTYIRTLILSLFFEKKRSSFSFDSINEFLSQQRRLSFET